MLEQFNRIHIYFLLQFTMALPKVAARPNAWTAFARSNAGIVGSNPTQGMDVCVCVYSVFVMFCVEVAAARRSDPPSKEFYRLCIGLRDCKIRQGPTEEL
jgi:hypothetical protein